MGIDLNERSTTFEGEDLVLKDLALGRKDLEERAFRKEKSQQWAALTSSYQPIDHV